MKETDTRNKIYSKILKSYILFIKEYRNKQFVIR